MDILKLARLFEQKVAQVAGHSAGQVGNPKPSNYKPIPGDDFHVQMTLANGQYIQQASGLLSEAYHMVNIYDAGYEEVKKAAGILFNLAKNKNSELFNDMLLSDLGEVKRLLTKAMGQLQGPERGKIQTAFKLLNSVQPVRDLSGESTGQGNI